MSRIVPSNPANSLTPSYSTVSSATGFQSGDLVYYKDGNFGTVPGNAVNTAPFAITTTNAVIAGPFGRNSFVSVLNSDLGLGVSGRQKFAATLTSGNIVVVYSGGRIGVTGQGSPFFRIVDSSFNTVVAQTTISADNVLNSAIGVAALTGGGFAVAYTVTGGGLRLAVYSNTGTVVTAPFTPSGWSNLNNYSDIEPLPSGGFVVAGNQTAAGGQYRVATYTATGTQVNANSPVISSFNSNDTPQIAVLTDGRFVVMTRSANTTGIMVGFNADCTTVGAGQTFPVADPDASGNSFSICSLSNNDVVFAYQDAGIAYIRKYFISSNSIGSATPLNSSSPAWWPSVTALSGDNIAVLMEVNAGQTALEIVSSSLSSTSLVYYSGVSLDTRNGNRLAISGVLVGPALTYFISTVATGSDPNPSTPIAYFQFANTAPYSPIYRRTNSTFVGSVNSPVSGYARGGSTPNVASFLASSSTTVSVSHTTLNGSNFIRAPYVAKGGVIYADSCVLLDGRMVVAYGTANSTIGFMVIDSSGSVVSDTSFNSGGSGNVIVKCTALNNGGMVIAFASSSDSNTISIRTYGSDLSLLVSTTVAAASGQTPRDSAGYVQGGFGLSSLGSSNFIVSFTNNASNRPTFCIFNSSAVFIAFETIAESGTCVSPTVAGNIDGTFTMTWFNTSSGTGRYVKYVQSSSTTWTRILGASNISWTANGNVMSTTSKMAPGGVGFHIFNGSGGNDALLNVIGNGANTVNTYNLQASSLAMSHAVAFGATGEAVVVDIDANFTKFMQVYSPGSAYMTQGPIQNNSLTISNANTSTSNPGPCAICECLYDNVYALGYRGTDGSLYIGTFSTVNRTYSASIVAGATPSLGGLALSPANGYYLSGVSASECAAGGAGVLQVNGAATLNSQYPAGTASQAFDFNTPALDVGVRGTISGRNMIISGGK